MRQIKFRAWSKERKEMLSCDQLLELGADLRFTDTHEWMQYTGLKDKNGKEIYEGDILISPYGTQVPMDVKWACVDVEGDGEHPQWYGWRFGDCLLGTDIEGNDHYAEVIGNIYENPELIK